MHDDPKILLPDCSIHIRGRIRLFCPFLVSVVWVMLKSPIKTNITSPSNKTTGYRHIIISRPFLYLGNSFSIDTLCQIFRTHGKTGRKHLGKNHQIAVSRYMGKDCGILV